MRARAACRATREQGCQRAAALLSVHSRALLRVFHWYALLAPGKGRVAPDALRSAAPHLLPQARLLNVLRDSRYGVRPERAREALATVLSLGDTEPQRDTAAVAAAAAASLVEASASSSARRAPATPRTPRENEERRLTFLEFAETLLAVAAATHAATRESQGALQQLERLVDCVLVDAQCVAMPLHVRARSPLTVGLRISFPLRLSSCEPRTLMRARETRVLRHSQLERLFLTAHSEMERSLRGDLEDAFVRFADRDPPPGAPSLSSSPSHVMTLEGWLRCMVCLRVVAEGKGAGRGQSGASSNL